MKKVTKEGAPRCRRNPEAADLDRAAKELAALKQLSPAFGFPAQGHHPRLRQRGEKPADDAALIRPTRFYALWERGVPVEYQVYPMARRTFDFRADQSPEEKITTRHAW
jgi:hypothetical protein